MKTEFKFDGVIPAGINGYALMLSKRSINTNSDGQRHFDISYVIYIFFITLSFSFIANSAFFNKVSLHLSDDLSN